MLGQKLDDNIGYLKWLLTCNMSNGKIHEYFLPTPHKLAASELINFEDKPTIVSYVGSTAMDMTIRIWCLDDVESILYNEEDHLSWSYFRFV